MLKNSQYTYSLPPSNALSVSSTIEVDKILEFVDKNIIGFRPYYLDIKDSDRENRISDFLVYYFNVCLLEKGEGFPPFNFGKNPTQATSGKETDIGVVVLTKNTKPVPIIEFEAKRFSDTSTNKEYVCGERGGIERFKRGHHSSHLTICGMFGYVQSRTSNEWITKVNGWIKDLSINNTDSTIDWTGKKEQLGMANSFQRVEKLSSLNIRKQTSDAILLWHYFIELN